MYLAGVKVHEIISGWQFSLFFGGRGLRWDGVYWLPGKGRRYYGNT
jgi:hypothetical protein